MSQCSTSWPQEAAISSASSTAEAKSVFIFQLPPTKGLRLTMNHSIPVRRRADLSPPAVSPAGLDRSPRLARPAMFRELVSRAGLPRCGRGGRAEAIRAGGTGASYVAKQVS